MKIVSRAEWGARATRSPTRMQAPASSVTAHHSLTPALPANASEAAERGAVQAVQRHHIDANGWADIGYNFLIAQSGRVYEGRGWGVVGAHAGTNEGNRTSVGVCFLINGSVEPPSPAALAAFYALRQEGERGKHLRAGHALKLHRDWKSTECPGDVAAKVLRERNGEEAAEAPRALLRKGDCGKDVAVVQRALGVEIHGEFDEATEQAVKLFQWRSGLDADGIVGPKTRRALGI